jgi:hypothetical protein
LAFSGWFCDRPAEKWHSPIVGTPSNPGTKAAARGISSPPSAISSDLEDELRSATDDFEHGDFIELSAEQLERCIANGESPWPDESRD